MIIGGVEITLSGVVDLIILIGALCGAIYKIYEFFAKPTSTLKKKKQQKEKDRIIAILDEVLPDKLREHDLQIRDKYTADRMNYLNEIKNEVLNQVGDPIAQNTDDLEALKISARDVLREKIMAIYHKNKYERSLTQYEKEALEQYYKDYKKLNGNSYIDKYYNRMKLWTIIYDDYTDDEE